MVEVHGAGGISAKVIADSVNSEGNRVTTFELEYPRFIHSEFMTHRLFSRNAASSRAIPVPKMIGNIRKNTAMPIHWGANQPGMKADKQCFNDVIWEEFLEIVGEEKYLIDRVDCSREEAWKAACANAIELAEAFHNAGYHKQIVNRLLEPFQFIKVVCTATEYDNFFWLRNHADAQPEIKELAECMWKATAHSTPNKLKTGEWHLPYVGTSVENDERLYGILDSDGDIQELSLEDAIKVSASCCAQVSYRLTNNSLEKAVEIYDMLVESKPVHASPFEHQCTPMDSETTDLDSEGVTGYNNSLGYYSGNFFGWIQNRQLIPENACWDYAI